MAKPQPSLLSQVAAHPMVFAIGVGVANGVLAAVRDKPVSTRAATATAAVLAAGEVVLVMDLPEAERPDLSKFALHTAIGVMLGMAPFVTWTPGEPSMVKRMGESLAPQPAAA